MIFSNEEAKQEPGTVCYYVNSDSGIGNGVAWRSGGGGGAIIIIVIVIIIIAPYSTSSYTFTWQKEKSE